MFFRKRWRALVVGIMLAANTSPAFALDLESNSYLLRNPSIGAAAGNTESGNFQLTFSFGKHVAIGSSESESFYHYAGVVPSQTNHPVDPGDINRDGVIDRSDVALLKDCLKQSSPECLTHDMDGDSAITILDVRKLMRACDCPNCNCP